MIRGVIEASFLDWDGYIVMVLYTPRCNFTCPFCHNWELLENPDRYPEKAWEEIEANLKEHSDFLDGVCVTGGEPLLEPDLEDLLRKIKAMDMLVKLDTNGSMPEKLQGLIGKGLVDYVAMDVKAPLDGRYARAAGPHADVEKVKCSIDIIQKSGIDHEFRTTVVPGIHAKEDVVEIAKCLGQGKYVLQQFVPFHAWDPALQGTKPYANEAMEDMGKACTELVGKVVLRGLR
jgi:pyruvate formate lyase activating enzyme